MLAYLGLGSNVGDKVAQLRAAVDALDANVGVRVRCASGLYRTEPQYVENQDWFLNAAVEVETLLEPRALLRAIKEMERSLGRLPRERYGPREIDIDLLAFPGREMSDEDLTVPHPRLGERAFALRPLADLAPELVVTRAGETVAALLGRLTNPGGVEALAAAPLRPRAGAWVECRSGSPEETERLGGALARACRVGEVFALCGELGAGKTCFARGFARGLGIRQAIQSPTFTLCRSYEVRQSREEKEKEEERSMKEEVGMGGSGIRERPYEQNMERSRGGSAEGPLTFYHWDFYRLVDSEEIDEAGFEDSLENPRGVVVVEWADRFPEFWDFPHVKVWLTVVDDTTRAVAMRFPEGAGALVEAVREFSTPRASSSTAGSAAARDRRPTERASS